MSFTVSRRCCLRIGFIGLSKIVSRPRGVPSLLVEWEKRSNLVSQEDRQFLRILIRFLWKEELRHLDECALERNVRLVEFILLLFFPQLLAQLVEGARVLKVPVAFFQDGIARKSVLEGFRVA